MEFYSERQWDIKSINCFLEFGGLCEYALDAIIFQTQKNDCSIIKFIKNYNNLPNYNELDSNYNLIRNRLFSHCKITQFGPYCFVNHILCPFFF